jgi:hypothetical protein
MEVVSVYYPDFDSETTIYYKALHSLGLPGKFVRRVRAEPGAEAVRGAGYVTLLDELSTAQLSEVDSIVELYPDAGRDAYRLLLFGIGVRIDREERIAQVAPPEERQRSEDELAALRTRQQEILDFVGPKLGYPRRDLLDAEMTTFQATLEADLARIDAEVQRIQDLQAELADVPTNECFLSEYITTGSAVVLSIGGPKENFAEVIFDKAIVDADMPCLLLVVGEKKWYKVYSPDFGWEEPDYQKTVAPLLHKKKNLHMYFTLATLGMLADTDYYIAGEMDLSTGSLTIDAEIMDEEIPILLERLNRVFAQAPLHIKLVSSQAVTSQAFIYNMSYFEPLLLDAILLDPVFNSFIYVDEHYRIAAWKTRLDVNYHPMYEIEEAVVTDIGIKTINKSTISATITQFVTSGTETINIFGTNEERTIEPGTKYVKITVHYSASEEMMRKFYVLMWKLFSLYKFSRTDPADPTSSTVEEEDRALLKQLFPQAYETIEKQSEPDVKPGIKPSGRDLLRALKDKAPYLAVPLYARSCQPPTQPTIVTMEQARSLQRDGEAENHLVWPDPNGQVFVCLRPNRRWVGLKPNRIARTHHKWVPCCFKRDPMLKTDYADLMAKYLAGKELPEKTHAKGEVRTGKLAPVGTYGDIIPSSIVRALLLYLPLPEQRDRAYIRRLGVTTNKEDPNMLILCVLAALGPDEGGVDIPKHPTTQQLAKDPRLLRTYEKRLVRNNKKARRERRAIADATNIAVLRQELYDIDDETIIGMLYDENRYLDPLLFYRALEEYYHVNIFVFEPAMSREDTYTGLAIPRNKHFHYHQQRPYPKTVLIYRTLGMESDKPKFPVCELIMDTTSNTRYFGVEMYNVCMDIMQRLNDSVIWHITLDGQIAEKPNLYKPPHLLTDEYVSQYIDGSGKLRALTYKLDNILVTATLPPAQPLNITLMDRPSRITVEQFATLGAVPVAYSAAGGKLRGLWLDDYTHVYVVGDIAAVRTRYPGLHLGRGDPLFTHVQRHDIHALYSIKSRLTQLIRYLYDVFLDDRYGSPSLIAEFADRYLAYVDREEGLLDVEYYTQIAELGTMLPVRATVEEILAEIDANYPAEARRVIINGKIVLYGRPVYRAILYMLEHKSTPQGPEYLDRMDLLKNRIPAAPVISGIYQVPADFISYADTILFLTQEKLEKWLQSTIRLDWNRRRYFLMRKKIETPLGTYTTPVIYRQRNRYWAISNHLGTVVKDEFIWAQNDAIADAQRFTTDKDVAVWTITPYKTMEWSFKDKGTKGPYVDILYYGSSDQYRLGVDNPFGTMFALTPLEKPIETVKENIVCNRQV